MLKTEASQRVRQTLQSVKERLAGPGAIGVSEADTRAHFIDPLLLALGYTELGEIDREVYVKDTKDFIDYTLSISGSRRIAVEAKRLSHKLGEGDAGQLIQYCAILGIEWAVLTNGIEWRLYHQFAQVPLADKLLFKLDLVGWNNDAQFDALFDQLWLLSKEAFEVSDGPGAWMRAQKLDEKLRDALTNPSSPEVKYLRKRLAEQKIDAASEDVSAWFKSKLLEPAPLPAPPIAQPVPKLPPPPIGGVPSPKPEPPALSAVSYWMVPASGHGGITGAESLKQWLDKSMWGFWESTPGRKAVRVGDWVAFYAVGSGVMAFARIVGTPDTLVAPGEWPESGPQEKPVYKVPLAEVTWLSKPVAVDATLRARLQTFEGRDPTGVWAWLVQTTRRLSEADFKVLTGT